MAAGYDGSIKVDSSIDGKGFQAGIDDLIGKIKEVAVALGAMAAVNWAANSIKQAAVLSSEFERTKLAAAQVGLMFGYTQEQSSALTDALIKSGIQTDIANDAFTQFAREGLDTSLLPALARGAQDLNVFSKSGESSSDMFNRLMDGVLTLNPLILRNAGLAVDLDQAYKNWADTNNSTVEGMSILEKRQAALAAVTEKLKGVNGLYEISQKTAAGQLSSNVRITNELQAAIGKPFQDALFTLIKGWNDLLKVWTVAIAPGGQLADVMMMIGVVANILAKSLIGLAQALSAVFGVSLKPDTKAVAASTGESATNLDDAAKAAADLRNNIEGSGKAAKGALASFDQLNVLSLDKGTGADTSAITMPVIDTSGTLASLDGVNEKMQEFQAALLKLFGPILEAFENLKKALAPLGKTIWEGLQWAWEHILVPFGTWVINDALPAFLNMLAAAATFLNDALIAFQPVGQWLWDNFLQPLSAWVGTQIIIGLQNLTDLFKMFSAIIKGDFAGAWEIAKGIMERIWKNIQDTWGGLGDWFMRIVITPLSGFFGGLWNDISAKATAGWNDLTSKAWGTTSAWFKEHVTDPLNATFGKSWESIKASSDAAFKDMKLVWGPTSEWFKKNVTDPLAPLFAPVWNGIVSYATWAFGNLTGIVNGIAAYIGWAFGNLTGIVNGVWDGIVSYATWAFGNLTGIVKGIVNAVIFMINGAMNNLTTGINAIISTLNNVGGSIPGWVVIPPVVATQIPYLATGAVIPPNSQFMAVLGDQKSGRNIEAPEDLIRQIVREEVAGASGQNITIGFDDSAIGRLVRELQPHFDREAARKGTSLLSGWSG